LYQAIQDQTSDTARDDIARTVAENAQATIDWMREEGCEFMQHPRRSYGLPMMAPGRAMRAGLDWEGSGPNLFLQILGENLQRGVANSAGASVWVALSSRAAW
jgi:hypothetical protein